MLLKCIQEWHERPYFGIAHYKKHQSVQNTRHLKASTLTLLYLNSVTDSECPSHKLSGILIEILWQIHELPKFNIFFLLQSPL